MLTVWKSREMRIADLALHGWEPVFNRNSGRHGVYHAAIGVGYSLRDDRRRSPAGDSSVKRWDHFHYRDYYEPCAWDEVTDWHLDAIDEWLRQL